MSTSTETRRAQAQTTLIRSLEARLAALMQEKESWQEAISSLQSEREANAILTKELENVRLELENLRSNSQQGSLK